MEAGGVEELAGHATMASSGLETLTSRPAPSQPLGSSPDAGVGVCRNDRLRRTGARARRVVSTCWRAARAHDLPPAPASGAARVRYRVGLAIVGVSALAFAAYFAAFAFAQQDTYQTHAEDMGIMMQALWNTTHGAPLHQTICNRVSDTNCLGDVSRLAIHFEPIMFPLALLYALLPSAKTLQAVQILLIAAGAFPAYMLAARRLAGVSAGVAFALLYLLFPSLDSAATAEFHAVALAAPFLMFALYFLVSRNTWGLLAFCVLAITTKEEVALTIVMLGLYALLLQRRWRMGVGLCLLGVGWIGMEVALMHVLSPLGHSPLTSRYHTFGESPTEIVTYLLRHPLQVAPTYLFTPTRAAYVGVLLAPLAYLALLSPATLLLAAPAVALNMLSNESFMYSGFGQYSAEIVPVVVAAAIAGTARLRAHGVALVPRALPAVRRLRRLARGDGELIGVRDMRDIRSERHESSVVRRRRVRVRRQVALVPRASISLSGVLVLSLVVLALGADIDTQQQLGLVPFGRAFAWPQTTAHTRLADSIIRQIPAHASVSAQSDLVPHLSNRRFVYLFPDGVAQAEYVLLDVAGNPYPLADGQQYVGSVEQVLGSGQFQIVTAEDGYLLLRRTGARQSANGASGSNESAPTLPPSFYSFTRAAPGVVIHRVRAAPFAIGGATIRLVGYQVSPGPNLYLNDPNLAIAAYWQVTGTITESVQPQLVLSYPSGFTVTATTFATTAWLPVTAWPEGTLIVTQTPTLYLPRVESGSLSLGARIVKTDQNGDEGSALDVRSRSGHGQFRRASPVLSPPSTLIREEPTTIGDSGTLVAFAQEQLMP
jgi:uncharacterized membrane protein